ncbi:MAG: Urease accessory protein ureE [Ferruginibacter sp.]|nr:Urease accessory protein ureE [Ferruginibacter sp.]
MVITEKIGNLNFFSINNRKIDSLLLEWYETNKRILHKKTISGMEVVMKFLSENQQLTEGDVVYEDDFNIITIEIKACDALIIRPKTMFEMASVCYEIGNKHLPVFYEEDEILVAFESPLFRTLLAAGYDVSQGKRKLINPLKTSVSPHGPSRQHNLFSKIMKLTNPPE